MKIHAMFIAVVIFFCGCVQVTAQVPGAGWTPVLGTKESVLPIEVRVLRSGETFNQRAARAKRSSVEVLSTHGLRPALSL